MTVNLLELAKSYLNDNFISQVSNTLGENEQQTQKALAGTFPTILNGLIQKSAEADGNGTIMNMITDVVALNRESGEVVMPTGGLLSLLDGPLLSTQFSRLLATGSTIALRIFGERTNATTNAIAAYSGIKTSSAASLLNLASPILISVLGKKLTNGTGTSVGELLTSQSGLAKAAIPAGLTTLLSNGTSAGLPFGQPAIRPVVPVYNEDEEAIAASTRANRWLPWLMLALGAVAFIFVFRSCTTEEKALINTVDTANVSAITAASALPAATQTAGTDLNTTVDSVGSTVEKATAELGAFGKRKLPSGVELNIPAHGIENELVNFIEDSNKAIDKTTWFNFKRLLFDTGKATLKPASTEEVNNMAQILKAFPQVAIKIGGYTDNTGNAGPNKALSQARANTVMAALVQLGIDKSRLDAEGYGDQHPVAPNTTAEGRAQNRRIAVRVTRK